VPRSWATISAVIVFLVEFSRMLGADCSAAAAHLLLMLLLLPPISS
jgi:hypothetical protein